MAENIKRVRAGITRQTIKQYFNNLEKSISGIPAANIINYDETNFTDDPGSVKVIVRRGVKHADRIMDTSKTSISVMVAGAADGSVLPPYILYKAKHLYPGWTEGGISGSAYNRNTSGWFDSAIFEDWFQKILLPYIRRLPVESPKVIIGDNLSSHLTLSVIETCVSNNIKFLLLPPNSTHLCQPLDVAYFRPLKRAWRNVLEEWKKKNRGVIPKTDFPRLLKKTFEKVGENNARNIISGFRACGIVPLCPQEVLKRIPDQEHNEEDNETLRNSWTDTFVDQLKEMRQGTSPGKENRRRGKRMNIEAGKAVVPEHLLRELVNDEEESIHVTEDNSEEETEEIEVNEIEAENLEKEAPEVDVPIEECRIGEFVLTEFPTNKKSRMFIGRVEEKLDENKFRVNFLRKIVGIKQTYFVFPNVEDKQIISTDIIKKVVNVKELRRGRFHFSSNFHKNVE